MSEQYVLGLQEVDEMQVAVVGGKGAHLGALSRIEGIGSDRRADRPDRHAHQADRGADRGDPRGSGRGPGRDHRPGGGTGSCPAGITRQMSATRTVTFGAACAGCPLRQRCTTARDGRSMTIHPHEGLLRAAHAQARPARRDQAERNRPPSTTTDGGASR